MGSEAAEDQTVDQNIEGKESEKAMKSKDQGVEDQSEEKVSNEHEGNQDQIREDGSTDIVETDDEDEVNYEISCLPDEEISIHGKDREDKIAELKVKVQTHKANSEYRLPSPKTVRVSRKLISYEVERLIAQEMLDNRCALMPDGTGRKVIGKVGGIIVQTEHNKMRTLPFQRMGNETRENWGDLILYLLQRQSILTAKKKVDFWHSILLFISDQ